MDVRGASAYRKLRPGPGLKRQEVSASQRARIHRAMVELAADAGHEHVTVRGLTRTAGVSSRAFYGHFANREECLADTVVSVGRELISRAGRRGAGELDWEDQMRSTLDSLLGDLAERPEEARLLLVEALAAGRPGRTGATKLTADLERLLARLLAASPIAAAPPRHLVVGIAAGVVRVVTMTTLTDRAAELPGLAAELADWMLGVYDERAIALCAAPRPRPDREARGGPPLPPSKLRILDGYGEHERILAAASRLAAGDGFAALTAVKIRREAGVSCQSFQASFGSVADCYLTAIESLARVAVARAESWAASADGRGHRAHRTILALSTQAARNPSLARLVLAGILAPGREGLRRREYLVTDAAARLGAPLSDLSVAAAWRVAEAETAAGNARDLPRMVPLLTFFVTSRVRSTRSSLASVG
jgi:AcrR family transcriptional regulator